MVSATAETKRFKIGLKGHKPQLHVDAKGRSSIRVGARPSEFRPESVEAIVVEGLSEDDAKGRFMRLQGIKSTTADWSVAETTEAATLIDPVVTASEVEAPKDTKPAAKAGK